MEEALKEAEKAKAVGEVPIGAVIVKDGEIIGRGYNLTETKHDPTAHAEMLAIMEASQKLGSPRLCGCELYTTVEPCAMCAGAIVLARIEKVYIGTPDPKAGACGSVFNIVQEEKLNHYAEIETGVLREECSEIMKSFFRELRKRNGAKSE
ncbi:MAG: tRNA adenosine(34) deaminase TadA [Eubacteriaceae bacterium]|nr:tRNA adenosine(34) deaminase TadA [Eubacteriaceae bacterium]